MVAVLPFRSAALGSKPAAAQTTVHSIVKTTTIHKTTVQQADGSIVTTERVEEKEERKEMIDISQNTSEKKTSRINWQSEPYLTKMIQAYNAAKASPRSNVASIASLHGVYLRLG